MYFAQRAALQIQDHDCLPAVWGEEVVEVMTCHVTDEIRKSVDSLPLL